MSTKDDEQGFYVCGRCRSEQFYLKSSGPETPCNVCGYMGLDKDYTVLPSEIKLDLTQY